MIISVKKPVGLIKFQVSKSVHIFCIYVFSKRGKRGNKEKRVVDGNIRTGNCSLSEEPELIYCSQADKKLSYCWETVRRESMPRIAEMDVEMTT